MLPTNCMPRHKNPILFGPLPPPYGGVSVFMSVLYAEVQKRGVEVWSYSGHTARERFPDAKFVDHRKLAHTVRLASAARGVRITDSTHFHIEYPHPVLVRAWLTIKALTRFHWVKIVHDGSLPFRFAAFSPGENKLFFRALRAIDELVVVTPDLAEFFNRIDPTLCVKTIPSLLPYRFGWEEPTDPRQREDLGKRVLSLGAFIPSYGFHDVVSAVEQLRESTGEDIRLILVAGSFASDAEYRSTVLGDREWINVLDDVPHEAQPDIYRSADVFVRAFAHESYGLSRIEAIWSGLPVVATDIGETRGMLTYKPGDLNQLTEHLRTALFGSSTQDATLWSKIYSDEAERNLTAWLETICGDSDA
jgi:glycosyltransferase involved in cell wall biosynthesis